MTSQFPFDSPVLLQFKSGLRELQYKLQQLIEKAEKEIREFADLGHQDAVDVSCFNSSKESMFADSSRNRNQLRLVQRALERIRDGSFASAPAVRARSASNGYKPSLGLGTAFNARSNSSTADDKTG